VLELRMSTRRFAVHGHHLRSSCVQCLPSIDAGFGAPGRIRTCDARFRKPTLYPLSYEGGAWLKPTL
jgi:hypothetical protein